MRFSSHVTALVTALAVFVGVAATPACDKVSSCNPMKAGAAEAIVAAWCERYVGCDASRGTVADCRAKRLAALPAQNESGCASDCAADDGCFARSSCSSDKVNECAQKTRAMACAEQVEGALVKYPDFCDNCFR